MKSYGGEKSQKERFGGESFFSLFCRSSQLTGGSVGYFDLESQSSVLQNSLGSALLYYTPPGNRNTQFKKRK